MNRRTFLQSLGATTASLALTSPGRAAPAAKPNILFIMVDDLGPEWLSCYGGEEMKTPNLDRMAQGGIRFVHAYSMPKCTPTRATPFRSSANAIESVPSPPMQTSASMLRF